MSQSQLWNAKHITPALTGLAAVLALSSYVGTASRVNATEVRHPTQQHAQGDWLVPTGKGWGKVGYAKGGNGGGGGGGHGPGGGGSTSTSNGIQYHGGPLITGTVDLYYIWYGSDWNFSTSNTNTILDDFGKGIGGSPYFGINTTYYDSTPTNVSGDVSYSGSATDTGSLGPNLSDSDVQTIVANAIASGKVPKDPNGVYFVLGSQKTNETSGLCSSYCAWHTHGTIAGQDIKYGFIGDPERCPSSCSVFSSSAFSSPNQNAEADAMANLIGHELAEATTDSDLTAWYDHRGYENADKCAWKFGTINTVGGGSTNVSFGGRNWLLQQNWINAGGGYCTLTN